MGSRTTTSVVVCTFNGAAYVAAQLQSVLTQTILPDEIVVSDDGSNDDTISIVRRVLAGASMRIEILQNPSNLGFVRNFEQAIAHSCGEIVLLCDQDDLWKPHRVEDTLRAFDAHSEVALVFSDARLIDATGQSIGETLFSRLRVTAAELRSIAAGRAFDVMIHRNVVTGATAAFRRSLFELAQPVAAHWLHDEWLAIIAAATGRIACLERPVIEYRLHAHNSIGAPQHGILGNQQPWSRYFLRENVLPRLVELLGRLQALALHGQISNEALALTCDRLEHLRVRCNDASLKFDRIATLASEYRAGRYKRWSRGVRSLVKDLVAPG